MQTKHTRTHTGNATLCTNMRPKPKPNLRLAEMPPCAHTCCHVPSSGICSETECVNANQHVPCWLCCLHTAVVLKVMHEDIHAIHAGLNAASHAYNASKLPAMLQHFRSTREVANRTLDMLHTRLDLPQVCATSESEPTKRLTIAFNISEAAIESPMPKHKCRNDHLGCGRLRVMSTCAHVQWCFDWHSKA